VLNPFVGLEIVSRLLDALNARGFDLLKRGKLASLIVEELRRGLDQERTAWAERLFKGRFAAGKIQFRLRLDEHHWRMPKTVASGGGVDRKDAVVKPTGTVSRCPPPDASLPVTP
jgi:type III restriction enzyme